MPQAKFRIGDLVKLNHRETKVITGKAKNCNYQLIDHRRARRIVKIVYHPKYECSFYYLGTNNKGKSSLLSTVGFRSYQLELITDPNRIGRPRAKRKYTKWNDTLHNPIVDIKVLENTFLDVKIFDSSQNADNAMQNNFRGLNFASQI